ncbi:MAG TPA: hypothetical protein VMF89_08475, partial [Polyangiales bacterium]|nr:hypothetical protein [Polyangiales bacterium]
HERNSSSVKQLLPIDYQHHSSRANLEFAEQRSKACANERFIRTWSNAPLDAKGTKLSSDTQTRASITASKATEGSSQARTRQDPNFWARRRTKLE